MPPPIDTAPLSCSRGNCKSSSSTDCTMLNTVLNEPLTKEAVATQPVSEFVCHLYSMLLKASYSDLISWIVPTEDEPEQLGGGISGIGKIVVHNPEALQDKVLGHYYGHSKYASFQRQLNYFGFKKRLHNGKKGKLSPCSYIHESLTSDMGSLFTLTRRPPSKKRLSNATNFDSSASDDSSGNETSSQHGEIASLSKRLCRLDGKKNKNHF